MNLCDRLRCFFGSHDLRDGPYIHSDHMVDTSYCARCDSKWGWGWGFLSLEELDKWEKAGRKNALERILEKQGG